MSVVALALSPLLLVAGGPLRYLYFRYVALRTSSRGILDKERDWISIHYFVVLNPVVLVLCWPSQEVYDWVRLSLLRRRHS